MEAEGKAYVLMGEILWLLTKRFGSMNREVEREGEGEYLAGNRCEPYEVFS